MTAYSFSNDIGYLHTIQRPHSHDTAYTSEVGSFCFSCLLAKTDSCVKERRNWYVSLPLGLILAHGELFLDLISKQWKLCVDMCDVQHAHARAAQHDHCRLWREARRERRVQRYNLLPAPSL